MKMKNRKLIGLIALVGGAILLYFGYNASQSVAESVTEAVTGRFTDETVVMLIGGAIAVVVGIVFLRK